MRRLFHGRAKFPIVQANSSLEKLVQIRIRLILQIEAGHALCSLSVFSVLSKPNTCRHVLELRSFIRKCTWSFNDNRIFFGGSLVLCPAETLYYMKKINFHLIHILSDVLQPIKLRHGGEPCPCCITTII